MSAWYIPLVLTLLHTAPAIAPQPGLVPVIEEPWISLAGNPDVGKYTTAKQQPVDFGIWQAADGAWQLWSCIRGTNCGGTGRLFHRWEGPTLTTPDWTPMGIAMESRPELGEDPGALQAPHVVRHDGHYVMAYGDWNNICFATSADGKTFERTIQPDGKTGLFSEGRGANTRDAMLLQTGGLWYCYYTAFPQDIGYVFARSSPDLKAWSPSAVVSYGGAAGAGRLQSECPHVVEPSPGVYVLFRTQRYGQDAQTTVYRSSNPLNFGIDNDIGRLGTLPVAAPEIILHEGQYYIAALKPGLDGIRIARLAWKTAAAIGEE